LTANVIRANYLRSLFWIAAVAAIFIVISLCVYLVLFDFMHGNPGRTREMAIIMMVVENPVVGLIAFVGSLIVFALPQWFQAALSSFITRRFGKLSSAGVVLALPITTLITWYSFDYLTPSFPEFEHGLTVVRYLATLGFQATATLFSVLYDITSGSGRPRRKTLIVLTLAATVVAGAFLGFRLTQNQIQLTWG
jgi:hypothetical protein